MSNEKNLTAGQKYLLERGLKDKCLGAIAKNPKGCIVVDGESIYASDIVTILLNIKRDCERYEKKNTCKWLRQFDGHFAIGCADKSKERANGNFHPDKHFIGAKWNFKFCPYCGNLIEIIYDEEAGSQEEK